MSETKKTDRRMVRTQTQLRQALHELILEKPYERISVQDILDRANIGRSTFYAHFQDKDDLLLNSLPEKILNFEENSQVLVPSLVPIFTHAQENYRLLRALMGSEGIALTFKVGQKQALHDWLTHITRLQGEGMALDLPPLVVAHYLTGAFATLLRWWLDEKMPYTPEEMDVMFRRLAMQGLGDTAVREAL